jgi:type IV pilus biogenesis/stability protein PilW
MTRCASLSLLLFLLLCGCGHTVPPLPNVDASRFQGDVAKAIEQAMAEVKANPRSPESTLAVCMVLHAHEQYQAAGQCYARAYALDPNRFDTLYCWGHALAADGAYNAAAAHLKQALVIRPESLPAQLKLAEVLTDAGDTAESIELYRSILAKAPGEPRAHFGLGRALGGDAAMAEFRKSLELFPRYGAAQFALAAAYRRKGDEAKAQEILRDYERDKLLLPPLNDPEMAAVRSLNASATGLMQRAASEALEGRLEEAASLYERAISADPKLTRAYTDLISLYGRLKRDTEAKQSYRKAITLDPNETDAYYNFGVFCFERGRMAEAKETFEHAVQLQPRHAEALNNLGVIYEQQGRWDQAAALYRQALDANASYPLAHFHLGRIYANQKKYAQAVSEFERSLDPKTESTPAYLYALAATHARAGNRQRAVELMRDARKEAAARGQTQLVAGIDHDLAVLERNP